MRSTRLEGTRSDRGLHSLNSFPKTNSARPRRWRRLYVDRKPAYAGLWQVSSADRADEEALEIYKKAIGIKDPAAKPDKKAPESKASGEEKDTTNEDGSKEVLINSPLLFDYAEALVFAGRYDEADKLLDPVITSVRKDHPAYLTAIRLKVDGQRRAGKRQEAVQTLEAALKGRAEVIVTGEKELLELKPFRGMAILSPAGYIARET